MLVKCNVIDESGTKSDAYFAPAQIIAMIPGKLVTNGKEVLENKLIVPQTLSIVQIILLGQVRLASTNSVDWLLGQIKEATTV